MTTRLVAIELEGFRGFARRQRISLNADAVLIRGDNGSGKTSLVDGFIWLFQSKLHYLDERISGVRTDDVVSNRFTDVAARVSLSVTADDHDWTFTRVRSGKGSVLSAIVDGTVVQGADQALADVFGHATLASLQSAVGTWGLLHQDAIRATLDSGDAMHDRLARIVGLEDVTGFADAVKAAMGDLRTERTRLNRAVQSASQRRDDAQKRYEAAAEESRSSDIANTSIAATVRVIAAALPDGFVLDVDDSMDLVELGSLGQSFRDVEERLRELSIARSAVDGASRDSDPEHIEAQLLEVQNQLETAHHAAPTSVRLAQAALEALDSETCPVCGQEVDRQTLAAHLTEVLARSNQLGTATQDAARRIADLTQLLAKARTDRAAADRAAVELNVRELAIREAISQVAGLTCNVDLPVDESAVAKWSVSVKDVVDDLRRLWRTENDRGDAHLQRVAAELSAVQEELDSAQSEHDATDARYQLARKLDAGAHEASKNIIADALSELGASFAEVFDRLNPNPAFTELRARQDVFRNRNQVVPVVCDPERGLEENPSVVFSEGQLNVVALSYFLGMALNARDSMLPFLVLDDPLQSLDVISVLGFGDMCRRIRDERQLIITTHDRRFADILSRKLAPRDAKSTTLVHDFQAWTRDGPSVQTEVSPMADVIPLVRELAS